MTTKVTTVGKWSNNNNKLWFKFNRRRETFPRAWKRSDRGLIKIGQRGVVNSNAEFPFGSWLGKRLLCSWRRLTDWHSSNICTMSISNQPILTSASVASFSSSRMCFSSRRTERLRRCLSFRQVTRRMSIIQQLVVSALSSFQYCYRPLLLVNRKDIQPSHGCSKHHHLTKTAETENFTKCTNYRHLNIPQLQPVSWHQHSLTGFPQSRRTSAGSQPAVADVRRRHLSEYLHTTIGSIQFHYDRKWLSHVLSHVFLRRNTIG